ncbi:hypothetical protein DID77_02720 [Candidatus Marinamargulisbacteria bacterium SCGC AG-439-L15]|nr:hypothetical protein DID77_02720 [Candidatus Marinamargulisbacteria bacterium SCGC AG-439-L15]
MSRIDKPTLPQKDFRKALKPEPASNLSCCEMISTTCLEFTDMTLTAPIDCLSSTWDCLSQLFVRNTVESSDKPDLPKKKLIANTTSKHPDIHTLSSDLVKKYQALSKEDQAEVTDLVTTPSFFTGDWEGAIREMIARQMSLYFMG